MRSMNRFPFIDNTTLSLAQIYCRSMFASEFGVNAIQITQQFISRIVCVLEYAVKMDVQLKHGFSLLNSTCVSQYSRNFLSWALKFLVL